MTDLAAMFAIAIAAIAIGLVVLAWLVVIARQRDRLETAHAVALQRLCDVVLQRDEANERADWLEHRGKSLERHAVDMYRRASMALAERDDAIGALEQAREWSGAVRANRRVN